MSFTKSAAGAFVGAFAALCVHDAISAKYPGLWQRWGVAADVVEARYEHAAPAAIPAAPALRRVVGLTGDVQQAPAGAGTIEWSGRPETRREVPR